MTSMYYINDILRPTIQQQPHAVISMKPPDPIQPESYKTSLEPTTSTCCRRLHACQTCPQQITYGISQIVVFNKIFTLLPTIRELFRSSHENDYVYHMTSADDMWLCIGLFLYVLRQGLITQGNNQICHWTCVILRVLYMLAMKLNVWFLYPTSLWPNGCHFYYYVDILIISIHIFRCFSTIMI